MQLKIENLEKNANGDMIAMLARLQSQFKREGNYISLLFVQDPFIEHLVRLWIMKHYQGEENKDFKKYWNNRTRSTSLRNLINYLELVYIISPVDIFSEYEGNIIEDLKSYTNLRNDLVHNVIYFPSVEIYDQTLRENIELGNKIIAYWNH